MKMNIFTLGVMLLAISFLLPPETDAAYFEFQPRFETGLMFYAIEQDSMSKSALSQSDELSGFNLAQGKIEISDNIGFVGGGGTFFIKRLFVDLSGQYAFNGSYRTQVSGSGYLETENLFYSSEVEYHGQFYRTDMAISAGYAVNRRLSVYAGYKWAAVDFDITAEGSASRLNIDNWLVCGRFESEDHDKFRYEGPFVGLTHGWEIDHPGFLKGLISAKVALAFLSSKFSTDQAGSLTFHSINGVEIEPVVEKIDNKIDIKGDTLGMTFGFDWHGMTTVKRLSYYIGLSGYRYGFDADGPDGLDVSETAVIFKAGLTYVF